MEYFVIDCLQKAGFYQINNISLQTPKILNTNNVTITYSKQPYNKEKTELNFDNSLISKSNAFLKGLDTYLNKDLENDGITLSGGEAQKVALARALYKNAPFLILDEPTAALDPITEAEIYSKFQEIAKNKTSVYIRYRLSSCRFCDDILVFHEGKIIQQGNHDTLVKNQ